MKVVKYLLIALMMLPMSLAMTSCSSEEDFDAESSQIVGTWRDSAYEGGSYADFIFHSDGTYMRLFYSGTAGVNDREKGKYSVANGVLTLYIYDVNDNLEDVNAFDLEIIDASRISIGGILFTKR